jgi:MSHA biogenesis protein MshJ
MKEKMESLLAKVDALSLRERVFLFLSVLVCCVAVSDALWLSPAMATNRKLVQQFGAQASELTRLRTELMLVAQPTDPSKAVRDDIAQAERQLNVLNAEINTLLPNAQSGPALEEVLVQFLRSHSNLTLLGLTTLSTDPASGTPAAAAPLPAGLTRKGLELKVSGPFSELVSYVKKLETSLPTLRWGTMELKGDATPPELTLQVYVLGVQSL